MEKEYFKTGRQEYTRTQRLANWFHYNKLWVFVAAVIVWVVGSMLWNVLGIGQTEPDCRFLYVGSRPLPQDCIEALERELSALAEDYNGDGTVAVAVTQAVTANDADPEKLMYGYGADVTVLADITDADSHFFLMEDPQQVQLSFQILASPDGKAPARDDYTVADKVYRWKDCPRLASLALGSYEDAYLDQLETGECQTLLENLYIGRRYYHDSAEERYPEGYEKLWQTLTEGATR